jgi:hypothetical protein
MNKLRIRTGDLLEIDNRIYEVKRVDIERNIYCYYGDNLKKINRLNFYDIDRVYRKGNKDYELVYEGVIK